MILILDENLSPTVADELNLNGYPATSFRNLGWLGFSEEDWLPLISQMSDTLVLSCDLNIFRKGLQRSRISENRVGIVFLTEANEPVQAKTALVISSSVALENIHENVSRPFAWFLYPDGRLLDNLDGVRL
jgi:predicted nuclease of predicted toxin-antitoxin system